MLLETVHTSGIGISPQQFCSTKQNPNKYLASQEGRDMEKREAKVNIVFNFENFLALFMNTMLKDRRKP